jgi:hypothetical protein
MSPVPGQSACGQWLDDAPNRSVSMVFSVSSGGLALLLEYYPWIMHKLTKKVGQTVFSTLSMPAPARAAWFYLP